MKFETPESLYEYIKANPEGYSAVLRGPDHKELYNAVKEKYEGYDTRGMAERFWLYCHGLDAPKMCGCGAKLRFINVVNGYSRYCPQCDKAQRRYRGIRETHLRYQQENPKPKCANTACDNPVFTKLDGTWSVYCSLNCRGFFNSLISRDKAGDTMMARFGVRNALENRGIYDRMVDGLKVKYGVSSPMHVPGARLRKEQTCMARYGVPNPFSSEVVKARHRKTLSERYGDHVYNISQIPGVQQKKLNSGHKAKPYTLPSGRVINLQGYEDRFLDIALNHLHENQIQNDVGAVLYERDDRRHHYFPDFLIEDGPYIEVKSIYTFYAEYELNMLKAQGVINQNQTLIYAIFQKDAVSWLIKSPHVESYKQSLGMTYEEHVCVGDHIVDLVVPELGVAVTFRPPVFASDQHMDALRLEVESQGYSLVIVDHV